MRKALDELANAMACFEALRDHDNLNDSLCIPNPPKPRKDQSPNAPTLCFPPLAVPAAPQPALSALTQSPTGQAATSGSHTVPACLTHTRTALVRDGCSLEAVASHIAACHTDLALSLATLERMISDDNMAAVAAKPPQPN